MNDGGTARGRYGYWFPLALLGFSLLVLLLWESVGSGEGSFAYYPMPEYRLLSEEPAVAVSLHSATLSPGMEIFPVMDWWLVLPVTVTLVGTVVWYSRGRSAGGRVALAVGCGILVPVFYSIAAMSDSVGDPAELVPSVGLPLVGLGALAGAWAYFRLGPWRRTAVVIGVASLAAGVATMLGTAVPGLVDPVLLAAGLLALAWYERSRLVGVVACAVSGALFLFPDSPLSTLIPVLVVFAAAFVALARRNSAEAPA